MSSVAYRNVGSSADEKARYKIDYTLCPDCCQIYISNMDNKIELDPACYDEKINHGTTSTYIVKPNNGHYIVNEETHTAKGTLNFIPNGETNSVCEIQPYNPTVIGANPIGFLEGTTKTVNLKVYYGAYSYIIEPVGRTGSFSHYNTATRTLYLGDGESMSFTVKAPTQKLATPKQVKVFFTPAMDANKMVKENNVMYYRQSASSFPTTAVWHNCDKENELLAVSNAGGTQYTIGSLLDDLVPSSTATVTPSGIVSDVVKAGYITVKYIPVHESKESTYQFPVYVEVRNNCTYNTTNFGTNNMTD